MKERLKVYKEKEKQEILKLLNDQFGIKEIDGIILQRGSERLFLFNGSFNQKQIKEIEDTLPIERVGTYFAKLVEGKTQNTQIRLSLEGAQIFKNEITKNIFKLNKKQMESWMKGEELLINSGLSGFVAMKYKNDLLGCGKASENKITNFVPKSRRLK